MKISDLQYIETAQNSEVEGGYNYSSAYVSQYSQAYGNYTSTSGDSYAIADAKNGVSLQGSSSSAYAEY
jgi:hypothetical protein